ncbi:hypothetical protein SAMN02910298_02725 [Pseudobutyrivibrio sp. YE44]|uniref:hypothetical protein n=1 Tax=Pseudobutyrivibrio sp. YE44 TaxID=1520802 RepID=UPI0008835F17|nr:hypothetical protein [Pseudobutyrivibrio sp. YE44]SDB53415.1 hypothetical protein SAMN02910298_02725 [Pseudobutyrivibrio sp. YE44]
MKKKIVIALALTLAVSAATAGTVSFVSNASAFRQARTPDEVNYGTLTDEQLEIINKKFDYGFYAAKYADVKKVFGMDKDMLLLHFVKCGVFEGRMGWPTYDPDELGLDLSYIAMVDVNIFAASNLMDTTDYNTVEAAVASAQENGVSIISTPSGDYIVATEENQEAIENASVEYEKLTVISRDGDQECVVIVYKTTEGFATKVETDMHNGARDIEGVIGFVPVVVMGVEDGNALIDSEEYKIEKFETETGMIIGTEAVTYSDTNDIIYYEPDNFETPHKRMMTNYVGTDYSESGYIDNAPIGIDENGTADSNYDVSAKAEADENGNAVVTTVISNDETGYVYKVTYTFDGTIKSEKAEAARNEESNSESTNEDATESTESTDAE